MIPTDSMLRPWLFVAQGPADAFAPDELLDTLSRLFPEFAFRYVTIGGMEEDIQITSRKVGAGQGSVGRIAVRGFVRGWVERARMREVPA